MYMQAAQLSTKGSPVSPRDQSNGPLVFPTAQSEKLRCILLINILNLCMDLVLGNIYIAEISTELTPNNLCMDVVLGNIYIAEISTELTPNNLCIWMWC